MSLISTREQGVTLVAHYGPKPPAMVELIATLQIELCKQLGAAFTAYDIEQVHSTLVGLEGRKTEAGILNTNLSNATGESRSMDLEGLLHFITNTPLLPLQIRIGGFVRSRVYPFTSRGLHPYLRTFTICGSLAVVIGWPVKEELYPVSLDNLRRKCARYNVLHKYHKNASDIDNDLFLVLGQVRRSLVSEEKIESVQNTVRDMLSSWKPLNIVIGREQISVVVYRDRQLPISSSILLSLTEAQMRIAKIESLYGK